MSVSTLPNVVYALDQKLVWISKQSFTCSFGAVRLRGDEILVEGGVKNWNYNIFKLKKPRKMK